MKQTLLGFAASLVWVAPTVAWAQVQAPSKNVEPPRLEQRPVDLPVTPPATDPTQAPGKPIEVPPEVPGPNVPAPDKPVVRPDPPVVPPVVVPPPSRPEPNPQPPVTPPPVRPDPNPPAPSKPTEDPGACSSAAHNVQATLQRYLGRAVNGMSYHWRKRVLGVHLGLRVQSPTLTFSTKAASRAIVVSVTVTPGALTAHFDAGVFGQHNQTVRFPQQAHTFSVSLPCPGQCAPMLQALGQRVLGAVNQHLFARLPTTLQLGKLKVGLLWPRLALKETRARSLVFEVSSFGAHYAEWGARTRLRFSDRMRFRARRLVLPCPGSPNPPTPPNPPAPPKPHEDPELSCNQRLPHKIHFATDKHVIDGGYKDNALRLGQLQRALATIPAGCALAVVGHTDCQGTLSHNVGLSQRRATSARAWSLARSPAHVRARGIGVAWRAFKEPHCRTYAPSPRIPMTESCTGRPRQPRFTDKNHACMVANRRVEFVVSKTTK